MRTTRVLLPAALLAASIAFGAPPTEVVHYDLDVTLDPATHRLTGSETVRWTNTTSAPTAELWWHLYLNAFASDRTTFHRELGGRRLRGGPVKVRHWGWTRITRMVLDDGTDLLAGLTFERPDDGNPDDFTVARTPLPGPVAPGGVVTVHLEFEAQLPEIIARTGWAGDFHLAGQWFPKLAVLEDAGVRGRQSPTWSCHQFHSSSEFYADFGSYALTVTVPEGWVVGASGVETGRRVVEMGYERRLRVDFRAERVHDVAWTAAPASLMAVVEGGFDPARDVPAGWRDEAARDLGRSSAELEPPAVHLRLLIPNAQRDLAQRMLRAARLGLAWYGLRYGPYPYAQLTIVSPPVTAREAGGMEYPTFITTGTRRSALYPPERWMSRLEAVTIHEFGHQYFYGLLASNEFEEAWLDEGLNSYAETACMAAVLRDGLVPEIHGLRPWLAERLATSLWRFPLRLDQFAWRFRSRAEYFLASYAKTAVALRTLEGLAGREAFAQAMRAYAERFRFRHPGGDDLFRTFNEVSGADYDWFFSQAFRGDATADWGVLDVRQKRVRPPAGFRWQESAWVEAGDGVDDAAAEWSIRVDLGRRGSLVGPVVVRLVWDDGAVEDRTWDGRERWVRWHFTGWRRLERVVVDPEGVWALEVHRADNYWSRKSLSGAVSKRTWWLTAALRALALAWVPWS